VSMSADKLVRKPSGGRECEQKRSNAVDTLSDMLAPGPQPAADIETEMVERGFARRQIDNAARTLDVKKKQTRGADGRRSWVWSLPTGDAAEPELPLRDGPQTHDAVPLSDWSAW
jgi:hypothetical protein